MKDNMETIELNKEEFDVIYPLFTGKMFWRQEREVYYVKWYPKIINLMKNILKKDE